MFWDGDTAHPWLVLAHQLAGVAAISGWAVAWSGNIITLVICQPFNLHCDLVQRSSSACCGWRGG